jgi:hypothetical protein
LTNHVVSWPAPRRCGPRAEPLAPLSSPLYAATIGVIARGPTADDAGTVLNAPIALFPVTPSAVPAWTLADDPEEG